MTTKERQERIFMCLCPWSSKGIEQEELNEFIELKEKWAQILFKYCEQNNIKELDISMVKIRVSPDNFTGKNVTNLKDFVEKFKKILKYYPKKYPNINKKTNIYWKKRNDSNKGYFSINNVKISFDFKDLKIGYCDGYLIRKIDIDGVTTYLQCTINSEHRVKDDTKYDLLKSKIDELSGTKNNTSYTESRIVTSIDKNESFKQWKKNHRILINKGFTINFWKIFKQLLHYNTRMDS